MRLVKSLRCICSILDFAHFSQYVHVSYTSANGCFLITVSSYILKSVQKDKRYAKNSRFIFTRTSLLYGISAILNMRESYERRKPKKHFT